MKNQDKVNQDSERKGTESPISSTSIDLARVRLPQHLVEAHRLLMSGVKLVRLYHNTKRPIGNEWNQPSNYVKAIDPESTGYGIPLVANGYCSIDPDNQIYCEIGLKALGFSLEEILEAGVRTYSTRPQSGGRSAFKQVAGLKWRKFNSPLLGTALELRATSNNLQDCCPGVIYSSKDGTEVFTQSYANDNRFCVAENMPELPKKLLKFWYKLSTDDQYYEDCKKIFWSAVSAELGIDYSELKITPETTTNGGKLALTVPGTTGKFNRSHNVEDFLERHGYSWHPSQQRWSSPNSSGSPGIREIPGKDGLWQSDHQSDPLSGLFDAWTCFVILDHAGDKVAALENFQSASVNDFIDEDEGDVADKTKTLQKVSYAAVLAADPKTAEGEALIEAYALQVISRFFKRYGYLMIEGKGVIVYKEFNEQLGEVMNRFANTASIAALEANRKFPAIVGDRETGLVRVLWYKVIKMWLEHHDRKTYTQPEFKPEPYKIASDEMPSSGGAFNMFNGVTYKPTKGDCDLIKQHVQKIWCQGDEELYDYVINWLARMVQKPGEQGRTVLVLRSGEGAGKNIIIDILARYFGAHACMLTRPEDLAGFNDHLATSVMVFLNEALWGGNKSVEGSIKSTITDDHLFVERKYVPKFKSKNCTHIIVASNNDWVLPMGIDDRRFVVMDLDGSAKGDRDYFDRLLDCIKTGGESAFLHFLLHEVDLAGFDVRKLPQNQSATKLDQKTRTMDTISRWWQEKLNDGFFEDPDVDKGFSRQEWKDDEPLKISREVFYDDYVGFTHKIRGHTEVHSSVSKKIHELLGENKIKTIRSRHGLNRVRFNVLPPLIDARLAFEQWLGQKGVWSHDSDAGD